jgi:hypothetical protein
MHTFIDYVARTSEAERSFAVMLLAFVGVMYFGRRRA